MRSGRCGGRLEAFGQARETYTSARRRTTDRGVSDPDLTVRAQHPPCDGGARGRGRSSRARAPSSAWPSGCAEGDATLWGPPGHARDRQPARLADDRRADARRGAARSKAFAEEVAGDGYATSCCSAWAAPRSRRRCCAAASAAATGGPRLHVLDSTDAATIAAVQAGDRARAHAVPRLLEVGRHDRAAVAVRALLLAARRRARTSWRSPIRARAWRSSPASTASAHVFHGDPEIGGRYSALSPFGIVPAALIGRRRRARCSRRARALRRWLATDADAARQRARRRACGSGAALSALAQRRPRQADVPDLADRCRASACGWSSWSPSPPASSGTGILPVAEEPLGDAVGDYGEDRVFVHLPDAARARRASASARARARSRAPDIR